MGNFLLFNLGKGSVMAKRKNTTPKDETKQDKFKRVVNPRVCKALKSIRLIGNCATSAYTYAPEDVATICTALMLEVENLQKRYESKGLTAVDFEI